MVSYITEIRPVILEIAFIIIHLLYGLRSNLKSGVLLLDASTLIVEGLSMDVAARIEFSFDSCSSNSLESLHFNFIASRFRSDKFWREAFSFVIVSSNIWLLYEISITRYMIN